MKYFSWYQNSYLLASLYEGSIQFPYFITAICLRMIEPSSSSTLVKVHDFTAPGDGGAARVEVWPNGGRVGAGTSDAKLKEGFAGVRGTSLYNTSTKQSVPYPILVLTAAISIRIIYLIFDARYDSSTDPKVFPHTRRELGSELNEVEWGETNPEVAATEIGDVRVAPIHCAERWECFSPFHRRKFDRSKVIDRQQHNDGNKLH